MLEIRIAVRVNISCFNCNFFERGQRFWKAAVTINTAANKRMLNVATNGSGGKNSAKQDKAPTKAPSASRQPLPSPPAVRRTANSNK